MNSVGVIKVEIIESSPKDIIAYRFYGEEFSQFSYYYTPMDFRFIPIFEIPDILALPDQNHIQRVVKILIPKGSPMLIGDIAPQIRGGNIFFFNKLGGGRQIYYPLLNKNIKILEDYNLGDLQHGKFNK